ncbi:MULTISPECIES: hypothetical protein [Niastella]|uniref:Uncharacterized protein n=1 Tax=Niastella soli TaxID=2821487 RepID=A0ABS3Z1C7_9BACT|nr:hypothetical protein [Niastella soli]MBO9203833.1 hypothetical protein [Niastella soli]
MRILYVTIFLLPFIARSQQLAIELKKQYPPSVIVRVNEVYQKLRLPATRQLIFARHFLMSDSVIATAIVDEKGEDQINKIKDSVHKAFCSLLTPVEKELYFMQAATGASLKEAQLMSAYLASKYKTGATIQQKLFDLLYQQRIAFNKLYGQYAGDVRMDSLLYNMVSTNDSVLNNYLYAIKGQSFLQGSLNHLQAIKPITQKDADRISSEFISLCLKKSNAGYTDNFYEALRRVTKDTAYYAVLFKDDILQRATFNTGRISYQIAYRNQLTPAGLDSVRPRVFEKEKTLAIYDYTLPFYTKYKDSVTTAASRYHDSLIAIAVMKDGSFPFLSLHATAIKKREKLALTTEQVDSLMAGAFTLQKMNEEYSIKNPRGKFDATPFEAVRIPALLNEDQYMQLLYEKNRTQAEEWSKKDWSEMVQRGMVTVADSVSTITQLTDYNIKLLAAKDRYANDNIKQTAYVNEVYRIMPPLLRQLKSARVKATVNTLPQQQAGINKSFQW